jgi:hypothetical protein
MLVAEMTETSCLVVTGLQAIQAVEREANRIWPSIPSALISIKDDKGECIHTTSKVPEGCNLTVEKLKVTVQVEHDLPVSPVSCSETPLVGTSSR